jgi:anti-sigma28 factor (negative regulator of flagellin synthesis)
MMPSEAAGQRITVRDMRIELIKQSVAGDEYAVDPHAVAQAILDLLLRRQKACS